MSHKDTNREQSQQSPESSRTKHLNGHKSTERPKTTTLNSYFPLYQLLHMMCNYRRNVFTCGHFGWGAQVRACPLEQAFIDGSWPVPCNTLWSHPLHSVKVGVLCKGCDLKRRRTTRALTKLKSAMQELHETVERLQKVRD